jgi:hypothetical protein
MGQKHWAIACALALAATTVGRLAAQQSEDPFGGAPSSAATPPSEPGRPDPGAYSSYTPGEARQRIEAALDQPLREPMDFIEQPLSDVMTILAQTYDLPVQFDTAALDAIAASPDVEVSININNVTLRSALDLMLKNAGGEELTYVIDKEVLLITTQEEAASRLEVKVYRVDDLIGDGLVGSQYGADADTLIDLIVASVESDSWRVNKSGEGEIKSFPPGMLVISQTHRIQEQVQDLLDELRRNKADVEATSAARQAAASNRPISRSISLDFQTASIEGASKTIREALITSADWSAGDGEISDDDKLLMVLSNRVLVRHLPHVVAQVEQAVRDFKLSPPPAARSAGRGAFGGGRGGRGGF